MVISYVRCYIVACLLLLSSIAALAQTKYEREYSMKAASVPTQALEFIEELFKGSKVHWYGEESLTGNSIEAKLKSAGKNFSIEFSTEGEIQDIEILSRFSGLPKQIQQSIKEGLKKSFKQYRITKTQVQWTGSKAQLKKAVKSETLPEGITVRYELIVKGRQDGLQRYYEVLCDHSGAIGKIREIVQRNADNLMY